MRLATVGFIAGIAFAAGIVVGVLLPRAEKQQPQPVVQTTAPPQETFESITEKGNAAMDAKQYREAAALYDKALAIRFDANVATDRGICLKELGENDRALAAFEFVTLRAPDHWQARYNRAVVLLQLGRVEEARAEATLLARQQPDNRSVDQLLKALGTK